MPRPKSKNLIPAPKPAKPAKQNRTPSEVGKLSRRSGHDFEREVANRYRERFADEPWIGKIRRSDQGFGAAEPDVTGIPGIWTECQHAADSSWSPTLKLEQAIRDSKGAALPVAITRRKGHRTVSATLRLSDLCSLCDRAGDVGVGDAFASVDFDTFLDLLERARPWDPPPPSSRRPATTEAQPRARMQDVGPLFRWNV